METVYDQEKLAAAEACFSMASQLLYCEPSENQVSDQIDSDMFEAAPFGMEHDQVRQGLAAMDAWCRATSGDSEALSHRVAALQREWLRLFVGMGTPEASCLESFYTEPNSHMFGASTLEVRAWYRRYDLQIERLRAEPDDHLGLMLGFVGHLAGLESEALAEGDTDHAIALAKDQETFLVQHVLPWLPAWHYATNGHATSDYFKGVANFVFGLCSQYVTRFGIRFDQASTSYKREKVPAASA